MAVSYGAPFMFRLFGRSGALLLYPRTDHTAADGQFTGRPGTVAVGAKRDAAWPYFGFADKPGLVAGADLGGRVLDCFATPGHHEAAVTYYDLTTDHLKQIQSMLRAHDLQPGRYVLPQMIITPAG